MHAFPYSPAATALLLRHKSPTAPFSTSTTKSHLSVGLLVPGTGTRTTELLGLHTAVVSDEEGTVVGDESLLELVLAVLVDVLLVVGDNALGDRLTDGVDLRGVTTTTDAHSDVDVGCKDTN